jgi:DNA-binding beta-propeller fold protein YncE
VSCLTRCHPLFCPCLTLPPTQQLGGKLSETLSAVYRGQSLVHGMGYAPDFHTIGVVAVASNAVVFISTAYNSVKHVEYVGRAPHEVMWRPDGR